MITRQKNLRDLVVIDRFIFSSYLYNYSVKKRNNMETAREDIYI